MFVFHTGCPPMVLEGSRSQRQAEEGGRPLPRAPCQQALRHLLTVWASRQSYHQQQQNCRHVQGCAFHFYDEIRAGSLLTQVLSEVASGAGWGERGVKGPILTHSPEEETEALRVQSNWFRTRSFECRGQIRGWPCGSGAMLPAGNRVAARLGSRRRRLRAGGTGGYLILSCLQKETGMGGGHGVDEPWAELRLELRFWCFQQRRLEEFLDRSRAVKSKSQGF